MSEGYFITAYKKAITLQDPNRHLTTKVHKTAGGMGSITDQPNVAQADLWLTPQTFTLFISRKPPGKTQSASSLIWVV